MFRIYYDASPQDIQKLKSLEISIKKFEPIDAQENEAKKKCLSLLYSAYSCIKANEDGNAFNLILEIGNVMRKYHIKDQDISFALKKVTGLSI